MTNSLLDGLPRGDPKDAPYGKPPGEVFTATQEIGAAPQLAYQRGRIFLGLVNANVQGSSADRKSLGGVPIGIDDNRHMVTIAGTRSGKGRSAIIPNMLTYPGSILATDPKGELATITARARSENLGQQVHVLDPFGVSHGAAVALRKGFNPLKAMRKERLIEDAALMTDALVVPTEGTKDPHWDDSARTFIEGLILYVKITKYYEESGSLATVRRLATLGETSPEGGRSLPALKGAMLGNSAKHSNDDDLKQAGEMVVSAAADFFERPPTERGSVLSTVRRHLKFLDYPEVRANLSRHDLNLVDLKRTPTTLYLCLPARHIGTCNRWLRLFVNMTLQAMEIEPGPGANNLPVLFCLDEFASLGRMAQIEDAAGQIAGFSVKLWTILQDLSQLQALYRERWETFLGNAGIVQCFGNSDMTTLSWISQRCGQTSIRVKDITTTTGEQSDKGASGFVWKTDSVDLITAAESAQIFSRYDKKMRQLIIWAGYPPLIIQRAHYDTHGMFKGMFDKVPTEVSTS